jgi:hypothetical protein
MPARMVARQLRQPLRRKEAARSLQFAQAILRLDERVVEAKLRDPRPHPLAVGRNLRRHHLPRNPPDPPRAVGRFLRLEKRQLPRQQRLPAPDRAAENRRRIRRRRHRVEHCVPRGRVDVLRFVRDQQQIGRLAARVRPRRR